MAREDRYKTTRSAFIASVLSVALTGCGGESTSSIPLTVQPPSPPVNNSTVETPINTEVVVNDVIPTEPAPTPEPEEPNNDAAPEPFLPTPTPTVTTKTTINDTGSTLCASLDETNLACSIAGFPGQDGEYGRDAEAQQTIVKVGGGDAGFDFSKLSSNGSVLSTQEGVWAEDGAEILGSQWPCVLDNTTELVWEVKHSNPSHPRYGLNTFSWYNPNENENGGIAGTPNGGACNTEACDTEGYVDYVNSVALCGFTDWRMPTVNELHSIAHQGKVDFSIDEHYFPNTLGLRYWTTESGAAIPQLAWYVYFSDASVSFTQKDNKTFVRLVRSDSDND